MLLLPPEYEVINPGSALQKIAELLHISALQGSRVKALTFGIKGPRKVGSASRHATCGLRSAAAVMHNLISLNQACHFEPPEESGECDQHSISPFFEQLSGACSNWKGVQVGLSSTQRATWHAP